MTTQRRIVPPDARQEQLLKEARTMVQSQAFHMKRALDANNIMEALKHAANMISELRTGLLHPRSYYALYILVFEELRHLELYIAEGAHNKSLHELYELVQYAGNILPRLYLLITVGSVYIQKMQAPAKDVLYDVVELCCGVQHPTRGLFLRTYLSEMTRDKLPDEGSKYEGEVTDSIDFILANFIEMNKLWVRMQHGIRDLDKREQEREELNILVGKNLSRLSQLEGLTIGLYKSDVLPRILSQIVSCRDRIAQQYLMVILIQAFSDDFHLRTLDQLLDTCNKLVDEVDVHSIVTSLIDRLANYCVANPNAMPADIDMFQLFQTYIDELAKNRKGLSLEAILDLDNSLISLALRCYKEKPDYIDKVYDFAADQIKMKDFAADKKAIGQALKLLQNPIEKSSNLKMILYLKSYSKILSLLPDQEKRVVSLGLISQFTKTETFLSSPEEVYVFLEYIIPLTKRDLKSANFAEDEWNDDQHQVACAINLFYAKDADLFFPILQKAKDYFTGEFNISPLYTLVPLTFKALTLVQTIHKNAESDSNWERKAKVVLKFANNAISVVKNTDPMIAFNLYLQSTLQSARCGLGEFANGFLTQGAFVLFEDEQIVQSKQQFNALRQLTAVVQTLNCFDQELYTKLATHIASQLTPKLIVHDFQSKAAALSAYLFATAHYKDVRNAQNCLKTAVSVAGGIVEVEILANLLVVLLDHYIYFFDKHPDIIDAKYVNAVITKIQKHSSTNNIEKSHHSQIYFRNIGAFVVSKQSWESYIKKDKPLKKDGGEVENEPGMTEKDAKVEAERWKEISFNN